MTKGRPAVRYDVPMQKCEGENCAQGGFDCAWFCWAAESKDAGGPGAFLTWSAAEPRPGALSGGVRGRGPTAAEDDGLLGAELWRGGR